MKKGLPVYIGMLLFGAGLSTCFLLLRHERATAVTPFATTWKTNQLSTNDKAITIPTVQSSTYNYYIDWGDGSHDSGVTGSISHTYATAGTYTVSISGTFPRISFFGARDKDKLLSIDSWGTGVWDSMVDAFVGCRNLQINATDAPNLSQVTSLSGMFREATKVNTPISHWDISNVTSIAYMFEGATAFNQSLSGWDTSNVQMFAAAFNRASSFNQNINSWDTSSALSTNSLFASAENFNQPLNLWDMSKVIDMRGMFNNAFSFNQDISSWNISSADRIESLFRNAINFEQDISEWNFSNIRYADNMFSGTRLSGPHYDKLLDALAKESLKPGVSFDAGTSTYCFAEAARSTLSSSKLWNVSDAGQDVTSCGDFDLRFDEGLGAALKENESSDAYVGTFLITGDGFPADVSYAFCAEQTADSQYFKVNGPQLFAQTSFDFEQPEDENRNNVYNVCVVARSGNFELKRLLTVAVVDADDSEAGSPAGSPGQVLGGSSDESSTVAGESTGADSSSGKVLAASGVAILSTLLVGTLIVFTPIISKLRTIQQRAAQSIKSLSRM